VKVKILNSNKNTLFGELEGQIDKKVA